MRPAPAVINPAIKAVAVMSVTLAFVADFVGQAFQHCVGQAFQRFPA